MERISSRQNTVVRRFRALHADRTGDEALLDGAHLIEEALSAGTPIDLAVFVDPPPSRALAMLADRTRTAGVRTLAVTPAVLSAISPVRHPSGAAAIARVCPASVDAALAGSPLLAVILHDVQDPGNVGAVIRSADACGATGVLATPGSADPFGWKALRGSMGSAFRVPVAPKLPMARIEAALAARAVPLCAAAVRGGTPLPEADLTGALAILAGGEGAGLPSELLARAAVHLSVPMRQGVESLNVAIAVSLILYEAARQRRDAGARDVPLRRSRT